MEGGGNSSNNNFAALNFGGSDEIADSLRQLLHNIQLEVGADGTEAAADYQTQVDWSFNLGAAGGSGGSFPGPVRARGSSSGTNHLPAAAAEAPAPGSGGIRIGSSSASSSATNQTGGTALILAGVEASAAQQATAGPVAANSGFAVNIPRVIPTFVIDNGMHYRNMVGYQLGTPHAQALYWDAAANLAQDQPVPIPYFHDDDNPFSLDSLSHLIPGLSSPTFIHAAGSSDRRNSQTGPGQQAANPSGTRASNTNGRGSNNFGLPEVPHAQYSHSLSGASSFSYSEFESFTMQYMNQAGEGGHGDWTMEDGFFDFFDDVGIDEDIAEGGDFLEDPVTGAPMDYEWLNMMVEPFMVPPPSLFSARRDQLISEVNQSLENAYRNGTVSAQEYSVIRSSIQHVPGGMPMPGANTNMSIDVENMSYEQLLELEDCMGNVFSGLSEATISSNVIRSKFQSLDAASAANLGELCCICQEEYADGDDLAKLRCLHAFHFACIKQWLGQKNECPICRRTATKL